MHCVTFYQLSLKELQSQLQVEMKSLETLKGNSGSEASRRKHVTELKREQMWLDREQEIAKVIEDVLHTGNSSEWRLRKTSIYYAESLAQPIF